MIFGAGTLVGANIAQNLALTRNVLFAIIPFTKKNRYRVV